MRVGQLPPSMVIIGGGFIAAEMGHVFEAFGTRVTIVQRGPRLLMAEDERARPALHRAGRGTASTAPRQRGRDPWPRPVRAWR